MAGGGRHRLVGAIAAVIAAAAVVGIAALVFMLSQPYMPGHFEAGADGRLDYFASDNVTWHDPVVAAASCPIRQVTLEPGDLDNEPRPTPAMTDRLAAVRCIFHAADATLTVRDGTGRTHVMKATAGSRRFTDLDMRFWVPWVISVVTGLMAGMVWALRPGEAATRLFAVNGLFAMISFMTIAVYTSHMPGSDPTVFWGLVIINQIANQVFFLSLIAMFLQYPRRLVPGLWAWGVLAVAIPFSIADIAGALPYEVSTLASVVVEILVLLGLIGWQWVVTRRDPRDRAALMWLGLAVAAGASLWLCFLVTIYIIGRTGDAGSIWSLVLVFPFYVGLAMGVARFCLVELQDWTFRILFFVVAAVLFVAVDIALITLLRLGQGSSAAFAVLLVAFAYLPLRDLVWRRFVRGKSMSQPAMFEAVMDIVFAPTPSQRAGKWRSLLQDLFQPLRLEPALAVSEEPRIVDDGLRLDIPAVAESPALSLGMARQGRELFSPSQLALVRQLIRLVRTASQSRDAYERGAAEERRRLAQDLHDDVGARLMTGLNIADDRTRPILHAALGDIRAIASGMMGKAAPLDRVLADIRHECVRRFEAAGLDTDWTPWPEGGPLILLDYGLQKALGSALREAASNIIRHAKARCVTVTVAIDGDRIRVRVQDDGVGLPETVLSGEEGGQGLKGLQRRLAEAGGHARFGENSDASGAWVDLTLPLTPVNAP